jgi:hypothetical protein
MYTCFIVSPRKPSNMQFKSFKGAENESINADSRVFFWVFQKTILIFFYKILCAHWSFWHFLLCYCFFFDFFSDLLSIKIEILKLWPTSKQRVYINGFPSKSCHHENQGGKFYEILYYITLTRLTRFLRFIL